MSQEEMYSHPDAGIIVGFSVESGNLGIYQGNEKSEIIRSLVRNFLSERGLRSREEHYLRMGRGAAGFGEIATILKIIYSTLRWIKHAVELNKQQKFASQFSQVTIWLRLYGNTYRPKNLQNYEITQVVDLTRVLGDQVIALYSDQTSVNFRISIATKASVDYCLSFRHDDLGRIPSYKIQNLVSKMKSNRSYTISKHLFHRLKVIEQKQGEVEIRC